MPESLGTGTKYTVPESLVTEARRHSDPIPTCRGKNILCPNPWEQRQAKCTSRIPRIRGKLVTVSEFLGAGTRKTECLNL
jgi:hypothetical protein